MKMRPYRMVMLGLALTTFAGCGDDQPLPEDLPACEPGTMQLVGTVGGVAVDLKTASGDGGFDQDDGGGEFRTQQKRESGRIDPTLMDLVLQWDSALDDGRARPATGKLRFPANAPSELAGKEICVGEGSLIGMKDGAIRFQLSGLATGPDCKQPLDGQAKGCFTGSAR